MKISVCMATYNGERFIKEQLNSILCQIGDDAEVIISDDGSTDKTIEIIKSYNDPRIKVFKNEGKKGFTHNFENSLKKAEGDYIFLSDQDDVWLPNKVKVLLPMLEKYYAVFSNAVVVDENLQQKSPDFFSDIKAGKGVIKNFIKSKYWGFGAAFRKQILKYALPFPRNNQIGHDMIIGFIADIKKSIYFEKTPLTLYRRHNHTVTNIGTKRKKRNIFQIIIGRIVIFGTLIRLYIRTLN